MLAIAHLHIDCLRKSLTGDLTPFCNGNGISGEITLEADLVKLRRRYEPVQVKVVDLNDLPFHTAFVFVHNDERRAVDLVMDFKAGAYTFYKMCFS